MKRWRILLLVSFVVIFIGRMYVAKLNRDKNKEQQQMREDLERYQMENPVIDPEAEIKAISDSMMKDLDAIQSSMDSIGIQLKESQERFKEQFKDELNTNE